MSTLDAIDWFTLWVIGSFGLGTAWIALEVVARQVRQWRTRRMLRERTRRRFAEMTDRRAFVRRGEDGASPFRAVRTIHDRSMR